MSKLLSGSFGATRMMPAVPHADPAAVGCSGGGHLQLARERAAVAGCSAVATALHHRLVERAHHAAEHARIDWRYAYSQ